MNKACVAKVCGCCVVTFIDLPAQCWLSGLWANNGWLANLRRISIMADGLSKIVCRIKHVWQDYYRIALSTRDDPGLFPICIDNLM